MSMLLGDFLKKFFVILISMVLLFTSCQTTVKEEKSEPKIIRTENFIGVWVNYKEINDLISVCNTQEELNQNIYEMLTEFQKYKINTVFLHCRAFDDVFYSSNTYIASEYCQNKKGELKFDILNSFLSVANDFDIQIHAWINPYRIRKDGNTAKINQNSLAGEWYKENPKDERLIITENNIYYNPASIKVQNYILNGVREILDNYNVAGIHIDDYFYPTTDKNIDTNFYNDYINSGGKLSLGDFRRQCVNTMVSSMYSLVKSYNEDLCFSISPSANIENDYNTCYADVKLWTSTSGYADFIIPQIYFGFNHETLPFETLLNEWASLKNDNVNLAVGLAVYKSGEIDTYAKKGANEWVENSNIILNQIEMINSNNAYNGYVYYSAKYLLNDYNENLKTEKVNILLNNVLWKQMYLDDFIYFW